MKKPFRRFVLLWTMLLLLIACADRIVEQADCYRISETSPQEYRYEVYSASGRRIDRGETYRYAPKFIKLDADMLKMTLGNGTNTYGCVYYRLLDGRKSEAYANAIAECGDYVLYTNTENGRTVLVAEKLFDRKATPYRYTIPGLGDSVTFDSVSVNTQSNTVALRYINREGTGQSFLVTLP